MFRKRELHALFICLIMSSPVLGQTARTNLTSHYYYFDQRIDVEVSEDFVAVRFQDNLSRQERIAAIQTETSLREISREDLPAGISLVATANTLNNEEIKGTTDRLSARSDILFTEPVFEQNGLQLIPLGEIALRFRENVSDEDIQQFFDDINLEIVSKSKYRENRFILRSKTPKADSTLAIANICNQHPLNSICYSQFLCHRRL